METEQSRSTNSRDAVVGKLIALHPDEVIVNSGCGVNCGFRSGEVGVRAG